MLILLLGLRRNERIRAVVLLNHLRSAAKMSHYIFVKPPSNDIFIGCRAVRVRLWRKIMPNFMLLFP